MNTPRSRTPGPFVMMLLFPLALPLSAQELSPERQEARRLQDTWKDFANSFASECETQEQKDFVKALVEERDSELLSFRILPSYSDELQPSPLSPALKKKLAEFRTDLARQLFALAERVASTTDVSLCYDLVLEVLDHDPDHGRARALLGFTKYRKGWATPYAAQKLRRGYIQHQRFGWIPKSHLPMYEEGKQLWNGRWIPREEAMRVRSRWANGWKIETEHYTIRTNTSLELGVLLSRRLEELYSIFFRLYSGYFITPNQMGVLFKNKRRTRRDRPKRFYVSFYKDQDEFIKTIQKHISGNLQITTGLYVPTTRTAYFYAHDNMNFATLVHEATHQLFSETREHRHMEGTLGNYWAIEGVACYMESMRRSDEYVELGSWEAPRLQAGRNRIEAGKYMPIGDFVSLNMTEFTRGDVYTAYTQAACLWHFLMHHQGGRFRENIVEYIKLIYIGQARPSTLASLVGIEYEELDELFKEHVKEARLD